MKRLLAIILTVLMLVSALPLTALAAATEVHTEQSVQYTCTEEEFKEILATAPQDEAAFEEFLAGVELHDRGYYYTYLTDSLQKSVYEACYNNMSPTNLNTVITSNAMNGYTYVKKGTAGYESSAYAQVWATVSKKILAAMWCYRYDNVEDCDSYTSSVSFSANFDVDSKNVIKGMTVTLKLENHSYYTSTLITQRDARIREIANKASAQPTVYGKIKAIHDELALSAEYDFSDQALNSNYNYTSTFYYAHSSIGVLVKNLGVCESYAKSFKLICDYMDLVPVVCIISETHMWNIVLINDEWYCVDVTWDDPGGTRVTYNYFLCGDPDVVDGSSTDHVAKPDYGRVPTYAGQKFNSSTCIHQVITTPDVDPTCTSTGTTGGKSCKHCGKVYEYPTIVAKKAHTTTYVSSLAPTYTADGYKSHYKCTFCNGLFSDAAATTPITYDSIRLPQLENNIGCNHMFYDVIPAIPATTEQCGMTEGIKCLWCDTYQVVPMEIPRIASIKIANTSYAYTGKTIKPGVVVTDELGVVIPSSNYTLSYSSGLKLPGTYTVTVKFKGNYSGTHKYSYKIIINKPSPKASTSTSSVKLSWGKVSGASGYVVYDANKKTIKDVKTATSYTISKRKAGTTYSYYVRTYKTISGKKYYSDYVKVTSSTLPATPKLSASSNASTIKVSWGKVTGASGYVVYNSSKGTIKDCGNTTSLYINSLKAGTSYSFYVRAYRIVSGKRYYSAYAKVSCSTKPANPVVKYSASTSSIKLSWGKVSGASGYIVYNSSKKQLSDRKTSTSYSISKLKTATNYTYYVRAYRKANGKTYYSDYVKVSAATLFTTPTISSVSSNSTEIKINWKKVSGASGYVFYNSDKSFLWEGNSSYASLRIYDCKVGTNYVHYMRAYKTVSGKRIYSAYVKVTYATKPTFDSSSLTIGIGAPQQLKLNTTASSVTWSTSDKNIATVNSSGVVTGKKAGTVTITATANGQKATIKIVVKKVSITLNKTSISLKPDYSYQLTATVVPSDVTVYWQSSNTNVATVNSEGKVTGVNEGSAVITAYIIYGGTTYSKTCTVTVKIPTYADHGYDDVPDFAAAVGGDIKPYRSTVYNGETQFYYYYSDVNWDGYYLWSLEAYREYLVQKGFSYVSTNTSNSDYDIEFYQNGSTRVAFVIYTNGDIVVSMWHY